MTEELRRIADVATHFGMSPRAVWTMVWRGQLPAVRIGRRVWIRRQDLERALQPYRADGSAKVA